MNDNFFVIIYDYAFVFTLKYFWQFLNILNTLTILKYYIVSYCWLFKVILP